MASVNCERLGMSQTLGTMPSARDPADARCVVERALPSVGPVAGWLPRGRLRSVFVSVNEDGRRGDVGATCGAGGAARAAVRGRGTACDRAGGGRCRVRAGD